MIVLCLRAVAGSTLAVASPTPPDTTSSSVFLRYADLGGISKTQQFALS